MSYHKREIRPQGVWGTFSKIEEEIDEIRESIEQENKILELCELADLIGAIEGYLANKYPGITLKALKDMSDATQRAFKSGVRKGKNT